MVSGCHMAVQRPPVGIGGRCHPADLGQQGDLLLLGFRQSEIEAGQQTWAAALFDGVVGGGQAAGLVGHGFDQALQKPMSWCCCEDAIGDLVGVTIAQFLLSLAGQVCLDGQDHLAAASEVSQRAEAFHIDVGIQAAFVIEHEVAKKIGTLNGVREPLIEGLELGAGSFYKGQAGLVIIKMELPGGVMAFPGELPAVQLWGQGLGLPGLVECGWDHWVQSQRS